MSEQREKEFVYKTTLREVYGLTDAMIRELGEPDRYVRNPHWKSGPPASLYRIERVEAWCDAHHDELEAAAAIREQRSASAQQAVATRIDALITWAQAVEIQVESPASLELAWDLAEAHYALRDWDNNYGSGVTYGGLVAYLRHQWTNYEPLLRQLKGRAGGHDAYHIIRERVDRAVEECIGALHRRAVDADEQRQEAS